MKSLIHPDETAKISLFDHGLEPIESRPHRRHVIAAGPFSRERSATTLDEHACLKDILHFAKAQPRNPGADPRLPLDESLKGQAIESVTNRSKTKPELLRQLLLIDRRAGLQVAKNDRLKEHVIRPVSLVSASGGRLHALKCQFIKPIYMN